MSSTLSKNKAHFHLKAAGAFGIALIAGRLAQAVAFFVMASVFDEKNMGAVALLTLIFTGLFQLTNMGFERYIVYTKDSDPDQFRISVDTVWTMQLLRSLFVLMVALVIGLTFAKSPQFSLGISHLMAISLAIAILSLVNPELSSFERSGNFSFVARARGYAAIAGAATAIGVVLVWPTPWAYVIGQIVNAAIFAGLSFLYSSRLPRIRFSRERFTTVFHYCKHLLVIAIVSFLSAQAQNIYVGALFGPATLGIYFTWYRLINLPRELITQINMKILFAKASDEARRDEGLASSHLRGFTFTVVALMPFHIFVWFHGDFLMSLLAGNTWISYWWAGRLMALASVCFMLSATIGPYMLVHLPHVTSTLRLIEAAGSIALIITLGPLFGVTGVLVSVLIIISLALIFRVIVLYKRLVTSQRWQHAQCMLSVLGVVVAPLLLLEVCLTIMPTAPYIPWLATLGYTSFSAILFWLTLMRRGQLIEVTV